MLTLIFFKFLFNLKAHLFNWYIVGFVIVLSAATEHKISQAPQEFA